MLSAEHTLKLSGLLAKKKNIVITTHTNPDGDAIGSSLGLYNFLLLKKHKAKLYRYPASTLKTEDIHWV